LRCPTNRGKFFGGEHASVFVNLSPLTHGHFLFVPQPKLLHPQVLTGDVIFNGLILTEQLQHQRPDFRVMFNSLGAFASVNHLHLQGVFLKGVYPDAAFPVEHAKRKKLRTMRAGRVQVLTMRLYSLSTALYSPWLYSLSTALYSLSTALHSLSTALYSLSTALYSLSSALYSLSTAGLHHHLTRLLRQHNCSVAPRRIPTDGTNGSNGSGLASRDTGLGRTRDSAVHARTKHRSQYADHVEHRAVPLPAPASEVHGRGRGEYILYNPHHTHYALYPLYTLLAIHCTHYTLYSYTTLIHYTLHSYTIHYTHTLYTVLIHYARRGGTTWA
jgi:hypothetical protein